MVGILYSSIKPSILPGPNGPSKFPDSTVKGVCGDPNGVFMKDGFGAADIEQVNHRGRPDAYRE